LLSARHAVRRWHFRLSRVVFQGLRSDGKPSDDRGVYEHMLLDGIAPRQQERSRRRAWRGKLEGPMSVWSKIDDLRVQVALRPLLDVGTTLEQAQEALRKEKFVPDRLVALGWEILLSRRRQGGLVLWHFSAKLYPHGRSSTENDWKVVGRIAARVGAPRDPTILLEDPTATVHWAWIEPPASLRRG
jgi:hypothetical protein